MELRLFRLLGISIRSHVLLSLMEFQTVKGHIARKHLGTRSLESKQGKSQSYHLLQPTSQS